MGSRVEVGLLNRYAFDIEVGELDFGKLRWHVVKNSEPHVVAV
jgi:hypothetical protein